MKVRTSIMLSEETLFDLGKIFKGIKSRSQAIEKALREYIDKKKKELSDKREIRLINKYASIYNKEAEDVLEYQADL